MARNERRSERAFTLIELLLVIAIIALLISILLPAMAGARKAARSGVCMANMKMFNTGFQNYSGDAAGLIASFSWQPFKPTPSDYADNRLTPSDAVAAHAHQAVEYVRKINGDASILAGNTSVADGRLLARNFTQLVLMYGGYYGERNPEPAAVCSEDAETKRWQQFTPAQASTQLTGFDYGAPPEFLPYYSSYQIVPCTFREEKAAGSLYADDVDYRLYYFTYGSSPLKQRRLDQCAFPNQKVVWFDLFDRHSYKRPIFYAYQIARQPLAFFDGSVRVMATRDSNLGWQNNNQTSPQPAFVEYKAINPLDPLPLYSSQAANRLPCYYRWTRAGLKGIDFGGKEVPR